jgi:cytoskeletal protein CcmA (bactofilin family)
MARPCYRLDVLAQPTVIPAQTRIEGCVETSGDLTVEGRCDGELAVAGTARIMASATCRAAIRARIAEIHGEVIGEVVCTESIVVAAGARVVGDLRAPDVSVDASAEVDGKVDLLAPAPRSSPLRRASVAARGRVRRPAPPAPRGVRSDERASAPSIPEPPGGAET